MSKKILFIFLFTLIFTSLASSASASELKNKLSGRILLQVEEKGEAWYVRPDSYHRAYLGRPADALKIMQQLGLGISNHDFNNLDKKMPRGLAGRILIKVEDSGRAYYVNPSSLTKHYLGRPADALKIMQQLGLGINNTNLNKIKIDPRFSNFLIASSYNKTETIATCGQPVVTTPALTPVAPTPVAPTPVAPTPVAPTPVAPTPVAPINNSNLAQLEMQIFSAINDYRKSIGLNSLVWNDKIAEVSRKHSQDMALGLVPFSHDGFTDRARELQLALKVGGVAENLAYNQGYQDPASQAVKQWLNSPGHKNNIVGNYISTGVGAVLINGKYYFTQMFTR